MEAQDPIGFGPKLKRFYNNKELSDAIIRCGDREFAVHKLVLFSHSDYFVKQLSGQWKESIEGVIDIADFDIGSVEAMVHFMYHLDYKVPSNDSSMLFHTRVYQIADKYDVQSLKQLARTKLNTAIVELRGWEEAHFPDVINLIWTTTPPDDRGLRDVVSSASFRYLASLMKKDSFVDELTRNGSFGLDIIRIQSERLNNYERYYCINCECAFDMGNTELVSTNDFALHLSDRPSWCPKCKGSLDTLV